MHGRTALGRSLAYVATGRALFRLAGIWPIRTRGHDVRQRERTVGPNGGQHDRRQQLRTPGLSVRRGSRSHRPTAVRLLSSHKEVDGSLDVRSFGRYNRPAKVRTESALWISVSMVIRIHPGH